MILVSGKGQCGHVAAGIPLRAQASGNPIFNELSNYVTFQMSRPGMPSVYESERLFSNSELRGHSEPGAGLWSQTLQGPGAHFAYREEIKDLPWVR